MFKNPLTNRNVKNDSNTHKKLIKCKVQNIPALSVSYKPRTACPLMNIEPKKAC